MLRATCSMQRSQRGRRGEQLMDEPRACHRLSRREIGAG
jgi:hypothetical protein